MDKKNTVVLLIILIFSLNLCANEQSKNEKLNSTRHNAITKAIEKVSPAVASINVTAIEEYYSRSLFNDPLFNFLFPDQINTRKVKSLGSGVIISKEGYVVTNAHVVQNSQEIMVTLIGGEKHTAKLIGTDIATDIALLKMDGDDYAFAELGSSDDIIIGEWVIALGNPFGLFSVGNKPTATAGIISGTNLNFGRQRDGRVYQDMIQTDASINTGNSGGPLINSNGDVIGINTFIFTGGNYSEGSIGIGFALPINRVKLIINELKKFGKINRAFKTGLSVQNVDKFLAKYLGLSSTYGVIVTDVDRNSSGDKAGIKIGDVIVRINKRNVRNDDDIISEIQENYLKVGDTILLQILRGKKELRVSLVLE